MNGRNIIAFLSNIITKFVSMSINKKKNAFRIHPHKALYEVNAPP